MARTKIFIIRAGSLVCVDPDGTKVTKGVGARLELSAPDVKKLPANVEVETIEERAERLSATPRTHERIVAEIRAQRDNAVTDFETARDESETAKLDALAAEAAQAKAERLIELLSTDASDEVAAALKSAREALDAELKAAEDAADAKKD